MKGEWGQPNERGRRRNHWRWKYVGEKLTRGECGGGRNQRGGRWGEKTMKGVRGETTGGGGSGGETHDGGDRWGRNQ